MFELAQIISELLKYPAGAMVVFVLGTKIVDHKYGNGKYIKTKECHNAQNAIRDAIDAKFQKISDKIDGVNNSILDIAKHIDWEK